MTAEQVARNRPDVPLIIDDGPTRHGQASTLVRVEGASWTVLRPGVLSAELLQRQTASVIVFVCTGNTCRSPLAESLCKTMLARRLGCGVEELPARGFVVLSAGLSAMLGGGAAEEAVTVAQEYGTDLRGHRSQPLGPDLVAQADYLVAMTRGHLRALVEEYGHLGIAPRLLSPTGEDVADPIGCDLPVYRACAQQIWACLETLLSEW